MQLTEEHNINKNLVAHRLGSSAEYNLEQVFEIRAVYRKKNECEWKLCSALIRKVDVMSDELSEQYKENSFFIVYKKYTKLSEIMFELYEDGIKVNDEYPPIKPDEMRMWKESLIPSISSQTGYPLRHLTTDIDSCNYGDEPLVGHNLTYHLSFNERLKEFISYGKGDIHSIHLLIDDSRAMLELNNDKVILNALTDVSVVGQIEENGKIEKIKADLKSFSPLSISKLTAIELWVIDENDIIYDYISSTTFPYRYELNKTEKTVEEYIQEKINYGESIDCEFKKFIDIDKGDSKAEEIDRTVCAFSNTNGGDLIIGVSDTGEIVGVDEPVRKKYKTSLHDSLSEYTASICKRLIENITSNNCFSVSSVEVCGKQLIVINVSKADIWNFLQTTDVPYKRKGATSFNATRLVALDYESSKNNLYDF